MGPHWRSDPRIDSSCSFMGERAWGGNCSTAGGGLGEGGAGDETSGDSVPTWGAHGPAHRGRATSTLGDSDPPAPGLSPHAPVLNVRPRAPPGHRDVPTCCSPQGRPSCLRGPAPARLARSGGGVMCIVSRVPSLGQSGAVLAAAVQAHGWAAGGHQAQASVPRGARSDAHLQTLARVRGFRPTAVPEMSTLCSPPCLPTLAGGPMEPQNGVREPSLQTMSSLPRTPAGP